MAKTLQDIKSIVERDIQDYLDVTSVVDWSNAAQNEFMLRIFIPGTATLAIDTSTVIYTGLPVDIREFRRFRLQSDLDQSINRPYYPVYEYYNGNFEVPAPFNSNDTLLIDYYSYLKLFEDVSDTIDLEDRYYPLYANYLKKMYYTLPSTVTKLSLEFAMMKSGEAQAAYDIAHKQVMDAYVKVIGTQKPRESGW
jgi:hypothetical protein